MAKKASKHKPEARSSRPGSSTRGARRTAGSVSGWPREHPLLGFVFLSAVWVLLLYWKALAAPFVYDDLDGIVNNPSLASLHAAFHRLFFTPVSFTTAFLGQGGSSYRPVYWLSLALDRQVWGIRGAGGFHLSNLLLHWLNGVLLFQLLRRLRLDSILAALTALLWLGLPINTEAVVWVSARAYSLSCFFLLASLLFACFYLQNSKPTHGAGFTAMALLAVFTHEQGLLILPLTLLLLWQDRQPGIRIRWELVAGALGTAAVYLLTKVLVGAHAGRGGPTPREVGLVFWKYIALLLAPVRMSVERSTAVPAYPPLTAALGAWMALLGLLAAAYLLRRRAPVCAAATLCGCLALLPFCGFTPIYQGMAERFLYLPSIGFAVALVAAAWEVRRGWSGLAVPGLSLWVLSLWVLWGAWRLTERVGEWGDPVTLYRSSLLATPRSPLLFYNLGYSLKERGDLSKALGAYRDALRFQPRYPQALASIGDIHAELRRPAEAIASYQAALALDPNDPGVVINEAVASEHTGNEGAAERLFQHAIALAPRDSAAYVDLGALYLQQHRAENAIACFEKAIENNPNDSNSYYNLAVLYQETGRDALARSLYAKVLALKPEDPDTLSNMARLRPSVP